MIFGHDSFGAPRVENPFDRGRQGASLEAHPGTEPWVIFPQPKPCKSHTAVVARARFFPTTISWFPRHSSEVSACTRSSRKSLHANRFSPKHKARHAILLPLFRPFFPCRIFRHLVRPAPEHMKRANRRSRGKTDPSKAIRRGKPRPLQVSLARFSSMLSVVAALCAGVGVGQAATTTW